MNETQLLTELSLPKATWFQRNLPFNQLSQRLTPSQRKVFLTTVQSYGIRIIATIKPSNTNIVSYEDDENKFEEIHLYAIELSEWKGQKEVFRILSQVIPYPLIIFFHYEDNSQLMAAKFHRHSDLVNLVIDEFIQSNTNIPIEKYIRAINFANLNKVNLKLFYESILNSINAVELKEIYNVEKIQISNKEYLDRLKEIDQEIQSLVNQAKKESQMNLRVSLNMKIQTLKKEKETILKELS